MIKKNVIQIFLLFVLLIWCGHWLFSEVQLFSCEGVQVDRRVRFFLTDYAFGEVNNAVNQAMSSAKDCLPDSLYQDIKKDVDSRPLKIVLNCNAPADECATTIQFKEGEKQVGKLIDVNIKAFWKNFCGCVQGVMLHELLHWGAGLTDSDEDEIKAYSCQLKCYPNCTSIPEKYQGKVKPELCCDKKN